MFERGWFRIGPSHRAPLDSRQAAKQVRTVENIPDQSEGVIAQHDHGQSRPLHRFQGDAESSLGEQMRATVRGDPVASDNNVPHKAQRYGMTTIPA
jgi:hypothetical protein